MQARIKMVRAQCMGGPHFRDPLIITDYRQISSSFVCRATLKRAPYKKIHIHDQQIHFLTIITFDQIYIQPTNKSFQNAISLPMQFKRHLPMCSSELMRSHVYCCLLCSSEIFPICSSLQTNKCQCQNDCSCASCPSKQ